MLISQILQAQAQGTQNGLGSMLPMLLIFGVFFFFFIWPQMRKQKKAKQYLETLKKGDKIVTTGGVHGKISSSADSTFTIETESGKLVIEKTAISADLTQARYGAASNSGKEKSKESEKPETATEETSAN